MHMSSVRGSCVAILFTLALCGTAQAIPLPTLALDPTNGALSGTPGATVGWGFTLTNIAADAFAVVTGSDFCVGVISSPCSNSFGTYTDFVGPQFIVVGPPPESSSVTQAFDNGTQMGLGSFLIDLGATGTVNGEAVLTYDLYSIDPNSANFDPVADGISYGNYVTALASVTVGTTTTTAPEPGTLVLLIGGLMGVQVVRNTRKAKRVVTTLV